MSYLHILPSSGHFFPFLLHFFFLVFVMALKSEILPLKLNGKNYFSWEFQLRIFLRGKNLWGHVNGTILKPTQSKESLDTTTLTFWEVDDAKMATWISSSVDQLLILNLPPPRPRPNFHPQLPPLVELAKPEQFLSYWRGFKTQHYLLLLSSLCRRVNTAPRNWILTP